MKEEFFATVLVFAAILSAAALPVYASPNDDVKEVINQCYKATDPDTIIRSCSVVIQSNPNNSDAYNYRAPLTPISEITAWLSRTTIWPSN